MSIDPLALVRPSAAYEHAALDYRDEFVRSGDELHGSGGLATAPTFEQWLSEVRRYEDGVDIGDDKVPATQYLAIRVSDDRLVGIVNLRHRLNDALLIEGGHIGYSVRASERRKGYATEILRQALRRCQDMEIDRVLLTCYTDNVASAAVIRVNGGVLDGETCSADGRFSQRYWVQPR